jgi:heme oxygenase
MDLNELRERTRPEHEAVEGLMPLMRPGLTEALYVQVLESLYPIVRGWESWALEHAPAGLRAFTEGRQRSPLLAADLQCFSRGKVRHPAPVGGALQAVIGQMGRESGGYEAVFLGAMYVMEGSTLGGQHIARHVEAALGLLPAQGDAYFRGYGERTGAMWTEFKGRLGAVDAEHTELVIGAAQTMFQTFGESLQRTLPV